MLGLASDDSREMRLLRADAHILKAGVDAPDGSLHDTISELEALGTTDSTVMFMLVEAYQVRGQHGPARRLLNELEAMGFRHPRMEALARRLVGANQPRGAQRG